MNNDVAFRALSLMKHIWKRPMTTGDPKLIESVNKTADLYNDIFSTIAQEAQALGLKQRSASGQLVPFQPLKGPYWPEFFRHEVFGPVEDKPSIKWSEKTARSVFFQRAITMDAIARAKKRGIKLTEGDIAAAMENHALHKDRPMHQATLDALIKKHGHIENHRLIDTRIGLQWDPATVMMQYARPAALRLNYAKMFGPEGQFMNELVKEANRQGFNADAFKFFTDVMMEQHPDYTGGIPPNNVWGKVLRESAGLAATKLGMTQLAQITQTFRIMEHLGGKRNSNPLVQEAKDWKLFVENFVPVFKEAQSRNPYLPEKIRAKFVNEPLAMLQAEAGAMRDAEHIRWLSQMRGFTPRLATWFLDTTLASPFDRFNRRLASVVGRVQVRQLAEDWKYHNHPEMRAENARRKAKGKKTLQTELEEFIDELFSGDAKDINDLKRWDSLSKERQADLQANGGWNIAYKTQYRTRPADLPLMASHPVWGPLYKFSSFAIRAMAETMRVLNPLDPQSVIQRNPAAARRMMIRTFTATFPAALVLNRIRQAGFGRDPEQLAREPVWQRFMEFVAFTGWGTWLFDWIDSAASWKGVTNRLAGPVYGSWLEFIEASAQAGFEGNVGPLKRYMLSFYPNTPLNLVPDIPTRRDLLEGGRIPIINMRVIDPRKPGELPEPRKTIRKTLGKDVDKALFGRPKVTRKKTPLEKRQEERKRKENERKNRGSNR
jgi:hypothetical protein